jgi:hypothetical protein
MESTISKTVKLAYQTAGIDTGAGLNFDILIDAVNEASYLYLLDFWEDDGEVVTTALAKAARHYGVPIDKLSLMAEEQLVEEILRQPGAEVDFIYQHYENFYNAIAAQVAAQVVEVE